MTPPILFTPTGDAGLCEPILRSLPSWFGIESATQHYIATLQTLPTWTAVEGDRALGFLSVMQHFPFSAEIYVMGVLPDQHRRGIGRALVAAAEAHLLATGTRFLQVKTLSPRHPDPGYARTRAFYERIGFVPLEDFDDLWGSANPARQMIKVLR